MAGISVELMPDAGAPQVGVTVDGLDGGDDSVISIDVSWDASMTWHGVRGAVEITVLGATFVRDFVPPLNVEATYRLTVHSGATVPATLEDTITVTSDTAWLQDPLNPRSAVPVLAGYSPGAVTLLASSAGQILRRQARDAVTPMGARLPVASVGVRQAPSGVQLRMTALASAQGALVKALRDLFDQSGTLVITGLPAGVPLDAVAHVTAGDVSEVPVQSGVLGEHNDWLLSVDQVRPQSLRVVVPWWTYDQVKALWAAWAAAESVDGSYDDVLAARPGDLYVDWLRDPEPV